MRELANAGVVVVPSHLTPRWDAEAAVILETLDSYHRHAAAYQQITGFDDEHIAATLRDDLRSNAPSLADFADHLLASLNTGGCAAYVPELGLGGFDPDRRALLLYALSVVIGKPSPTDAHPPDSLLVADNHRALHARTGFADRRRHLLRVRMRGDEPRNAAAFPMLTRLQATVPAGSFHPRREDAHILPNSAR
ncbi:hypothetical protein A6A40_00725 [Azospirillum humicireducens]|uniref:Uncharacterized protein n=1 Tax=Azospirillum humicireducens TaxID=1226968 RepID=A0A161JB22_9PROT|nr:TauD/TfdA family dioxygenase [Azospirillum humicireducens]ANC90551.1 hypothetical protein A6A40_00725 [Azospirillum humicireducens]